MPQLNYWGRAPRLPPKSTPMMQLLAASKSAFSIIGNQLAFYWNSGKTDIFYTLDVALVHILELVAGSTYAEMMGAYSSPQIILFKRFQTHRKHSIKPSFRIHSDCRCS